MNTDQNISIEQAEGPSSSSASSLLPEPTFRSTHVQSGRIICQICFVGCEHRYSKRNKYHKITDWEQFKKYAIHWRDTNHAAYRNVYNLVDWSASGDKWAHKLCKGLFFKDKFLQSQVVPNIPTADADNQMVETVNTPHINDNSLLEDHIRQSSRKQLSYNSSWQNTEKKRCIICNEDRHVKGRIVPVQTISITDKAEETLKEYANIHLQSNNLKYVDGANRILLTLATKSLLAADVAYHKKLCYEPFRSPVWKRAKSESEVPLTDSKDDALEDIFQLVLVHIVNRHEIYTMSQLKAAYDQIRTDKGLSSHSRSTDLKDKLQQKFGNQLNFHRATQSSARSSEFVFPLGAEFTANVVQTSLLGGGISKSLSLKNTAKSIHMSIKDTCEYLKWPPTPQDILEVEPYINGDLYNELAWIVDPNAQLNDDGKVKLSQIKATKIQQIAQDIQALLPKSQPSLDQVLLSLTMHRKTGSSGVVDTLHGLGYGMSYTETIFIEDKWAEWSEQQHSDIPSNILKGIQTTHIADNIDWKNKALNGRNETHNTNSILVQHKDVENAATRHKAQVSALPDYNFKREDHHAFIAKPVQLPQYIKKKSSPQIVPYEDQNSRSEYNKSTLQNHAWVQCRRHNNNINSDQTIPAWSAFRQLTTEHHPPGVNVGYLPAITAPPTQMNVILSILDRTMKCKTELELDFIFMEVDQAIYNKVLQVMFQFKQEGSTRFDNLIVRMGGFHIVMCLMKSIYSRFSGSGIIELLSEAGVGAEGTIKSGLNGSNVKQGVRYYKLLFEALLRSKLNFIELYDQQPSATNALISYSSSIEPQACITPSSDFIEMQTNNIRPETESVVTSNVDTRVEDSNSQDALPESSNVVIIGECDGNIPINDNILCDDVMLEEVMSSFCAEQTSKTLDKVVDHPEMKVIPPLIGGMAMWMDSFIDMVGLLLNLIHFQRTGNWEGFLEAIDEFLPWCFGLNRQNYARNMSYYYVDMRDLKRRHPDAYKYLVDGGFSGSLSGEKHTKIPMDQIIEVTINRFSKETGGLSGKTENAGASERWMRINHYLAALKQHLEEKVRKVTKYKHVELGTKRILKDESDVQRIVSGLHAWVPNLWSPTQPLMNIATGVIAPDEMVTNVTTTKERGTKAKNDFFQRMTNVADEDQVVTIEHQQLSEPEQILGQQPICIEVPRQIPGYNDPIKRQKVCTFDKITDQKSKVSITEDEGRSFATILAEYDEKRLDLRYIMDWPITSKPWSICNEQGEIRTTAKSLFRNNLQLLSPQPAISSPSDIECSIVDAMRVVRIVPINGLAPATFQSWATRIVSYLKSLPGSTLHLVFDDYRLNDAQPTLSKGRQEKGRERILADLSQKLPNIRDWNDFLTNRINKLQITQLLANFLLSGESDIEKDIFVTKGSLCMYLPQDASHPSVEVPELHSSQKEADPRLALHAVYATARHTGTCVVADDTDVYILLIFVADKCTFNLYFRQGTTSSKEGITYHNVKALANHLGEQICKCLPAFHVLTGSDYTQPFFGRSKFCCFKKMQKNPDTMILLSSLDSTDADVDKVIDFTLHVIYNRPKKEKTPGDSRYAMLFSGKGKKRKFTPFKRLPPDEKSLKCAIHRVNFVVHSMVNCLKQSYESLDVLQYGWKLADGVLVPVWYEGDALPSNEELSQVPLNEETPSSPDEAPPADSNTPEHIPDELIGFQFAEDDPESDDDDDDDDVQLSADSSESEDE